MKLLMRGAALAAAAAALLAGLAACGGSGSSPAGAGGTGAAIPLLRVGVVNPDATVDPLTTQGCADEYCGLFMERLMKFSSDGKLAPELAASVTQPDALTDVFHLRHGVKFWDGNEMTSADVVASLGYQEAPGSETATYYTDVKSIIADGPYTVTVTLKQPDSAWAQNMAYEGVIFEKSFFEAHKASFGKPGTLVMGTGPWEIDSLDPTRGAELSANPHWWGGTVPVQRISYKFFTTETSEALAMRAGEIDVASPSDGATFAASSGAKVVSWPDNVAGYFSMNVKLAPWNDIHVRRAVAYALNRPDIIAAGGSDAAEPLYDFFPLMDLDLLGSTARVSAITAALPKYSYDLVAARAQMAESAHPHGFTASTETCQYGNTLDQDQVVVTELAKIGITLKLKIVSCSVWSAELYGPKTFGASFGSYHSSIVDPSGLAAYLLGSAAIPAGGLNAANYGPAPVDSLLQAGVTTSAPAARLSIYQQVLTHIADDVPYVPLYQSNAFIAFSSKFTIPPLGMDTFEFPWALDVKLA